MLDIEPGKFRELEPEELTKLKLAAEGKWRAPKPKETKPREFKRREGGKPEFVRKSKPRFEERRPQGGFERKERTEHSSSDRGGDFRPKKASTANDGSRANRDQDVLWRSKASLPE